MNADTLASVLEALKPYSWIAELLALPVSVLVAAIGWSVAHRASLKRQRLKQQFDFVSEQLSKLYGPLYSLVTANTAAFEAYRKVHAHGQPPRTEEEARQLRAWAAHVFVPSNLKIRDVIERNAHLLVDNAMPDCFVRMLAHAESSHLAIESIEAADPSMLDVFEPWPHDFNAFVRDAYFAVSQEHARLLGRMRMRKTR